MTVAAALRPMASSIGVYMYFMLRSGWHCQFLEPDLKTALPKKLTFTDARKIVELTGAVATA